MFSFASLTQNYIIAKNRFYESIFLLLVTIILFRPKVFIDYFHFGNVFIWYLIGATLFGVIFLSQIIRARAMTKKTVYE